MSAARGDALAVLTRHMAKWREKHEDAMENDETDLVWAYGLVLRAMNDLAWELMQPDGDAP